MVLGITAYLLAIVTVFAHYELANYESTLVLLGMGWNFVFIGRMTLLPQSYQNGGRFKAQAPNEITAFGAQTTAAICSGWLLFRFGWQNLLFTVEAMLSVLVIASSV